MVVRFGCCSRSNVQTGIGYARVAAAFVVVYQGVFSLYCSVTAMCKVGKRGGRVARIEDEARWRWAHGQRGLREGSGQIGDLVEMSGRRWHSGCEMG